MKRIINGKYIVKGYLYKGYEVRFHSYYPPEKKAIWEAIDINTGCGEFFCDIKKEIKGEIDLYH